MKTFSRFGSFVLFFILSIFTTSCECNNVDCAPAHDPDFLFHFVSQESFDLLNGEWKKYDASMLRLVAIDTVSGDSSFADVIIRPQGDSLAVAVSTVTQHTARWYLMVDTLITDTIDFTYTRTGTHCCGTYVNFSNIMLNGDRSGVSDTVIIVERQ